MFTKFIWCLSIIVRCGIVVGHLDNSNDLWSIEKPGNIILHGIFPLRERAALGNSKSRFNFEGIAWMGAMIRRITELNRARVLGGNVTIGYSIRDSSKDSNTGLKQTLSVLDELINQPKTAKNGVVHVPVVIGPATDRVISKSEKLYELFNVSRIIYSTTSNRFNAGKIVRTVPSDHVYVEVLLRHLMAENENEVSVIASRTALWRSRAKSFKLEIEKRNLRVTDVIYIDTVNGSSLAHLNVKSQVVVLLAEANIAKMVINRVKKLGVYRTWIAIGEFDDPLMRVFNVSGKLHYKIIIRNSKQEIVDHSKAFLMKSLEEITEEKNWLNLTAKKYVQQCLDIFRNASPSSTRRHILTPLEYCRKEFKEEVKFCFKGSSDFHSSLTLQGVADAVDLLVNSVKDTLVNCGQRGRADGISSCLRFPEAGVYWSRSLSETFLKRAGKVAGSKKRCILDGQYTVQILRHVERKQVLGNHMGTRKGWTFEKVREWNITSSDVGDKRDVHVTDGFPMILSSPNNFISPTRDNHHSSSRKVNSSTRDNYGDDCIHCDDSMAGSSCETRAVVIHWSNGWAIALYILELLMLLAVVLSLAYFHKHKSSPIMILCYSWPDNFILTCLCLFCCLPLMHIGEMTSERCVLLWPIVNVMFAFYSALLLTKTLFMQNLLKCEVATERPVRRMVFSVTIAAIQLIAVAILSIVGHATDTYSSCTSRGFVILCDVRDNIGILVSMAFNWFFLFILVVLAIVETLNQKQNFCRTENLISVAVVGLATYSFFISSAYFELQLKHYLVVTIIHCIVYLVNAGICLALIYLPTLRLVSTWLRQHIRQQRNLTSIKRAQVMSSKRESVGPLSDPLYGMNFSPAQTLIPSQRQSGYYFDLRPASAATDLSFPNSLIPSVHEPTHFITGYGRSGTISHNEGGSFQSVTSIGRPDTLNRVWSRDSIYDNVSTAAEEEETANELSPEELLHEITTYWQRPQETGDCLPRAEETADIFINGQYVGDIEIGEDETTKWPSLEHLRASKL